jgi:hypothetical protein
VTDVIKSPSHYTSHPSGIEPIEISKHETFIRGNIIKYVMRAPYKGNELQDLRKAAQYLAWEIERVEAEQAKAKDPELERLKIENLKQHRYTYPSSNSGYYGVEYRWDRA